MDDTDQTDNDPVVEEGPGAETAPAILSGSAATKFALISVAALALIILIAIIANSLRPGKPGESIAGDTPPVSTGDAWREPAAGQASPAAQASGTVGVGTMDLGSWRVLLKQDPLAAAKSLAQMPVGEDLDDRMIELMEFWTEGTPDAAGAWLAEQPRGEFRDHAAEEFGAAWGEHDPRAAANWLSAHLSAPGSEAAIGAVSSSWAASSPDEARAWIATLPAGTAKLRASGALAFTWSTDSPHDAARWAESIDDGAEHRAAVVNIANSWGAKDPASAAVWIRSKILDTELRDAAALTLIHQWAGSDPLAASKWIAGLPGGQLQETSKAIFAESLAAEAPSDAIIWARSIEDTERRNEAILNVYEGWMDVDQAEFSNHVRQHLTDHSDPKLREQLFDLLYEQDPQFRSELIQLYENR